MAYAYNSGLGSANRGIIVSGLSGNITVSFKLMSDMPDVPRPGYWFLFDGRYISGSSYLYGSAETWSGPSNVSNFKINGISKNFSSDAKTAVAGDVLSFAVTASAVGSGFVLFNRFNFTSEVAENIQITDLKITDNAGVHNIAFPASGNSVPDPLGTLTITVQNGVDSQWVYYDAGGSAVNATIATTMPQMQTSGSASVTTPTIGASIAFNMPQMQVATSGNVAAPGVLASIAFAMPQMQVAASAGNIAPTIAASVAMTMPQMTVAVSGNVVAVGNSASINFAMPQMVVAASASKAVPVFSATVAATMPQMQIAVSADVQAAAGVSASIALTMPQMAVVGSASTTAPAISASISFTMPQMSVYVLSGEFDYYGGIGSHIEYAGALTHIETIAASTHIEYTL